MVVWLVLLVLTQQLSSIRLLSYSCNLSVLITCVTFTTAIKMQKSTSSPHKSHWNRSFDLSKFHCPLHSSSTGRPTGPQQITNRLLHENDGYFWMTISNNFDFVSRLCIGLDGRKNMAAGRRVLDKFPSFFSAMPLSCYLSITFLSFFLSFFLLFYFWKKKNPMNFSSFWNFQGGWQT